MRAAAAIFAAALAGCMLPAPDYSDTRFRCDSAAQVCPDGFTCEGGWCRAPEGPDAGADPADGDSPLAQSIDAAPPGAPDAAAILTAGFGERGGADFTGVTTDATLLSDASTANHGADDLVGIDASPIHIGLIRFDLSALPADAQVLAAELDLYEEDPIETGDYQIHAMLLPWSENQATYDERTTGVPWPSPGAGDGSYATAAIGSLVARTIGPYTVPLDVAAVQAWVSAPAQNYGMRWSSTSPDGHGGNWDSSESGTTGYRPLLRITYQH
jgi:hypothetical protein